MCAGLYLNPPHNAVVWSVDEKSGMQAKSGSTRPNRPMPGERPGASSSTSAMAPPCSSPVERPRGHNGRVGHRTRLARTTSSISWATWSPRHPPGWICIASSTTSPLIRPAKVAEFLAANPQVHLHSHAHPCQLAQPGRAVLLDTWNVGCCAEVNSTQSMTWPSKVIAFIKDYNRRAAPFRWTYDGRPLQSRKSQGFHARPLGGQPAAYPMKVVISIPGRLHHAWWFGAPGEDAVERIVTDVTRADLIVDVQSRPCGCWSGAQFSGSVRV